MSKSKPTEPVSVSSARLDRKSRLSLPEKEFRHENVQRRNTISEYTNKGRKKVKPPVTPTIMEDEDDVSESQIRFPVAVVENEIQKASKVDRKSSNASRHSVASKSSKSTYVYDNFAYEGNVNRPGSTGNSIRNPGISKAPSLQSLGIYQEQYCCFSKRTKCERSLLITVIVLCIIIVVLVIVIGVLAKHIHDPPGFQLFSGWH